MLSPDASALLILTGVAVAVYLLVRRKGARESASINLRSRPVRMTKRANQDSDAEATSETPIELLRWQVEMHETASQLKGELDSKLSALSALVLMARGEAQRLESAIAKAESLEIAASRDTLAMIESLAEPRALENPASLAQVAAYLPQRASADWPDPFEDEQKVLAIARLSDQGNSPPEIAQRLDVPLGEVELRLSLRSH